MEVPAYMIVLLFMDLWGRKPLFSLSLIGSGKLITNKGFIAEGLIKQLIFTEISAKWSTPWSANIDTAAKTRRFGENSKKILSSMFEKVRRGEGRGF